jgi:hypothetical protein
MQMYWILTPEGHWALAGLVVAALVAQAAAVLVWQGRRVKRLDARVAQLSAALALLTDTVEAGLQDVLSQVTPVVDRKRTAAAPARANTRRRIRSAAKRGRPVEQIAAAEQMSEGEVRLMLQMSGAQSEAVDHAEMR